VMPIQRRRGLNRVEEAAGTQQLTDFRDSTGTP
jgi:hypothetical protein